MKLIKVDSCVSCPFCLDTVNLCRSYPKKYKCQKTFIGIDAKYFIKIDGIAEIPVWCPLEDYVKTK